MFGKSEKINESLKILDQCLLREHQVSKYFCKTLYNKDMAARVATFCWKNPSSQISQYFNKNEQKKLNFWVWQSLKFQRTNFMKSWGKYFVGQALKILRKMQSQLSAKTEGASCSWKKGHFVGNKTKRRISTCAY